MKTAKFVPFDKRDRGPNIDRARICHCCRPPSYPAGASNGTIRSSWALMIGLGSSVRKSGFIYKSDIQGKKGSLTDGEI